MSYGNGLGAHVRLPWETPPNRANTVQGLGTSAAGGSESQQNMSFYG